MNNKEIKISVVNWKKIKKELKSSDLVIVASGFEDRSLHFIKNSWHKDINNLLLVRYKFLSENEESYNKVKKIIETNKHDSLIMKEASLDTKKPLEFEKEFKLALEKYNLPAKGSVWFDISGIPTFSICLILSIIRKNNPLMEINIVYTEAEEYFPTEIEYSKLNKKNKYDRLPDSLTLEMSENIIYDTFSGFTIRTDQTCLILFAGYEKHRSVGVIENINPSKIALFYGKPRNPKLKWRLELSKELHSYLKIDRVISEETVSTLDVNKIYRLLEDYYDMLYPDHNICISPINSKMQAIATYLIWEKYKDIQLVFPMPISYLPNRFSKGAGNTFHLIMPYSEDINLFRMISP